MGCLCLTLASWWEGGEQTSNTANIILIGSKAMIVSSSRSYERTRQATTAGWQIIGLSVVIIKCRREGLGRGNVRENV